MIGLGLTYEDGYSDPIDFGHWEVTLHTERRDLERKEFSAGLQLRCDPCSRVPGEVAGRGGEQIYMWDVGVVEAVVEKREGGLVVPIIVGVVPTTPSEQRRVDVLLD